MGFLSSIFGDPSQKLLKKYLPLLDQINELEKKYQDWEDEKLHAETNHFKNRLEKGESLEQILPEAFAVAREAAKRTIGQRH